MQLPLFYLLLCISLSLADQPVSNVSTSGGYKNVAYFVNWGIYKRNFHPQNLTAPLLTHVHYAFANIRPNTSEVYLNDTWADTDKHYPSDSSNGTGQNLYGCAKQLYLLKKHNRHLKTLLSIGGYSYSPSFASAVSTPAGRATFANTSVSLLANLGFDGLDIGWEFPANDAQATDMVSLVAALRAALDEYSRANNLGYHFLLTVAGPAGPQHYNTMHLQAMDVYLDYWNLMAYDYTGSFSNRTGHQANLNPSSNNSASTPFSTSRAVGDYLAAGVPAHKLVLGIPVYGRAFTNTAGLGLPFSGVGPGTTENGVWDYKDLPRPGSMEMHDDEAVGSYAFDHEKKTLVSYDTAGEVQRKLEWASGRGLGGSMFWEASGDRVGNESLVGTAARVWASKGGMDVGENWLGYPVSKYGNLKAGMPGE